MQLEAQVLGHLRSHAPDLLTASTAGSTRAAGDAIENIVSAALPDLLGDLSGTWAKNLSRRDMADAHFQTGTGARYAIDVKSHLTDARFSMPNLISVFRLAEFYEHPDNVFLIVLISYSVTGNTASYSSCRAFPIEWLSWESLAVRNLGKGQIQLKNTRKFDLIVGQHRADWMIHLCDRVLTFYEREAEKILDRAAEFRKIRERWATPR